MNHSEFSQPICTALQIALVEVLRSWRIYPTAVVGHSSGEIAAAFAAGALSRESAWSVAYHRGVLSGRLPMLAPQRGSMMAVALPEDDMQALLRREDVQKGSGHITVACINSPR